MPFMQKHKTRDGDVFVVFAQSYIHEKESTARGLDGAMGPAEQMTFGATPLWETVEIGPPGSPFPHVPAKLGPFSVGIIAGPTFENRD
jgi:hypothetical protein